MELSGSCRCGKVTFKVQSHTPMPYMRCYCSICRKLDGGGGYAINIMGMKDTLVVQGQASVKTFAVELPGAAAGGAPCKSSNVRSFCGECGAHLWCHDENWAHWVYPYASAIDSELPTPPHSVHIMLGSKAGWVQPQIGVNDQQFDQYPDLGIEEWHKKNGCCVE